MALATSPSGQIQAPAAADDRFARPDTADLTIELATVRCGLAVARPADRAIALFKRPHGASSSTSGLVSQGLRVRLAVAGIMGVSLVRGRRE